MIGKESIWNYIGMGLHIPRLVIYWNIKKDIGYISATYQQYIDEMTSKSEGKIYTSAPIFKWLAYWLHLKI